MITAFCSGPFETNAYLVWCPKTQKAAVIDPAPESAQRLIKHIQSYNLKLDKIILTHSHWDHFGDLKALHDHIPAPIYIHPEDQENIKTPGSDGLPMFFDIHPMTPTHLVENKQHIQVGDLDFEVIHTPGHTPGGICLYEPHHKMLISGDTLFKGSIGNLAFPTAEPDRMWQSLETLSQLPKETAVYPGHGEMTYLKDETWLKNAKQIFK